MKTAFAIIMLAVSSFGSMIAQSTHSENYNKIPININGVFPNLTILGYSAHWVRLRVNEKSVVTGQFIYN